MAVSENTLKLTRRVFQSARLGLSVRTEVFGPSALAVIFMLCLVGCVASNAPTAQSSSDLLASLREPANNSIQSIDASGLHEIASGDPISKFPAICTALASPTNAFATRPGYIQYEVFVQGAADTKIANLKQSDFVVSIAGKSAPVVVFHEAADTPISMMLVIDTSGSMAPKLTWVRQAAGQFISELESQDQIALVAYSSRPFLLQPLTIDHSLASSSLLMLHAFGQTATYDATMASVQILGNALYPSKAIVLITNGIDNSSATDKDTASRAIRQRGIAFYAIGIGDSSAQSNPLLITSQPGENGMDAIALEEFASASGGQAWIVNTGAQSPEIQLSSALTSIAQLLGRSYSVGVIVSQPIKPDTTAKIEVKGQLDASVRACQTVGPNPPIVANSSG